MSLVVPNTDDGCNTSDLSGLTTGLLIETVTNSGGQYEQISPRWRRAKYAIALLIVTAGRKKTTPISSHHNLHAVAADDDQVIQAGPYAPLASTPPPPTPPAPEAASAPNTDDSCNSSTTSVTDHVSVTTALCTESATASTSGQYERRSKRHWRRIKYVVVNVGVLINISRKKTRSSPSDDHHHQAPCAPFTSTAPQQPPPPPPPAAASAASDDQLAINVNSSSAGQPSAHHAIDIDIHVDVDVELNVVDVDVPVEEWFPNKVARVVRDKDLDLLQALGGVDVVLHQLRSHLEAAIHANGGHQAPQSWNTSNPVGEKGFLYLLWKACNKCAILILLITAIPSFAIGFIEQGFKTGWHDGAAILLAVLILVSVPSVANYLHERKLVRKHFLEWNKLAVSVERSNEEEPKRVTISDVVVGDILHLEKGDRVPVDGLFMDGENLVLDEVLIPKIDREGNPFVLSGSKVVEGRGRIFVISVGANTALAEVLSLVTHDPQNEKRVLQALMDKPYVWIDYLALCGALQIALVVLIRVAIFSKHDNYNDRPELKGEVSTLTKLLEKIFLELQGRIPTLSSILATVVIGIQQGMPIAVTLALVQWKKKMVQNQADPQNQSACVIMDRVTVMCIGTTGEGMCSQMEVKEFWMGEKDLSNEEGISETNQVAREVLHHGICAIPTKDCLISWLKSRWGADIELLDQEFEILGQRKLSSNEKCSGILVKKIENDEPILQLHWTGDATTILDMCSHYYDNRGETHIMANRKRIFKQVVKNMEEKGLRSIAYAYKEAEVQELSEDGLYLLALVGLRSPYQEELLSVVEALRNAGKSIKLMSGDELSTVIPRALELGIITPGSRDMALKGEAFRKLTPTERLNEVDKITVMGSCLPKDMFLMVESLKKKGHIVAYYGGLTISDTATLKEADAGITKDICSTEMAKENSDIIIKDGCLFTSILESSTCAYHNIQKFYQLQLTVCISGLFITLVATMHSGQSPITAIHFIWVNLIMFPLGSLMMVMEFKGPELLTQGAPMRTQLFITKVIWRNIATQVSYQASVFLILHFMGNVVPSMDEGVRNTMIFNTFTLCQVVHLFNAISLLKKEVLEVVLHSKWFLMALGAFSVMQVVIVEFVNKLGFGVKLNALQWATCCLLAALSWVFDWSIEFLSAALKAVLLQW